METISLKEFLKRHNLRLEVSVGSLSEDSPLCYGISIENLCFANPQVAPWLSVQTTSLPEAASILCRHLSGVELYLANTLGGQKIIGPYQIISECFDSSIYKVSIKNNRLVVSSIQ